MLYGESAQELAATGRFKGDEEMTDWITFTNVTECITSVRADIVGISDHTILGIALLMLFIFFMILMTEGLWGCKK